MWALPTRWKEYPRGQNDPKIPKGYTVWILPATFCAMRFINDAIRTAKEVPHQRSGSAVNQDPDRQNNVRFRNFARPTSMLDFRRCIGVQFTVLCNIVANSELFVCYGETFNDF